MLCCVYDAMLITECILCGGVALLPLHFQTLPRPTVEMKETVLPPLLLALQQVSSEYLMYEYVG